jgi:hypothetical protein
MQKQWMLISVAIAGTLLSGMVRVVAQDKAAPDSNASDNASLPKAPEQPGLPEVEVDVADLAVRLVTEDPAERLAAHAQLRKLPKNARRVTIGKLSAETDANLRADVWRAFAKWVREEDVPLLIDSLGSKSPDVRAAAAELLARYPEINNLQWLARQLADPQIRYRVQELLIDVGPPAEPALLAYAGEVDPETRAAAWETLAHVGGSTALRQLRQQAAQPQFAKDDVLAAAIAQIASRSEQSR